MPEHRKGTPSAPQQKKDPAEEGSAAKRQHTPNPPSTAPDEEGSAAKRDF